MRLMAIDFGSRRVGIASTDESGRFALPRAVLPNTVSLLDEVVKLAREWEVEKIIVGESKNLDGEQNPIMREAEAFVALLKKEGLEIEFHPEVYTSMEAQRLQGKNEMSDASAAAIILKSYIDSQNN
ncbi:MAG: Holliday junction resolvase RuvX [Parcubacteria group bacterium]